MSPAAPLQIDFLMRGTAGSRGRGSTRDRGGTVLETPKAWLEHSVNWFITGSRRCQPRPRSGPMLWPDALQGPRRPEAPASSSLGSGLVLWMRHFPTIYKREWLGGWVASGSRSSGKRLYFLSRGRIQMSAIPLWFMAKAANLGLPNILTAPNLPLRAGHSWRDP